jgi:hypothetical protein
MFIPVTFNDKKSLQNFIETEIRLAMQQEKTIDSGLDRAAIAQVRADRIMGLLEGHAMTPITEIPTDLVKSIATRLCKE